MWLAPLGVEAVRQLAKPRCQQLLVFEPLCHLDQLSVKADDDVIKITAAVLL